MERVVEAMESSQPPLSIESFSHSWLINFRPSFEDSLVDDPYDETAAFIELDPKLTPSKRFLSYAHDFSFDSNFSHSPPLFLVHADELFSNGLLMPIFINPSKMEASNAIKAPPPPPAAAAQTDISEEESSGALIPSNKDGKLQWAFLRRCRRSSKWIFHKYVSFFKPLYQKVRDSGRARSTSRTESIDRIWGSSRSPEVSPRNSSFSSTTDWCDIDDAVLHCKKSFEKGERLLQRG
ncbi:probable membrane-associated kinase regulator 6 [Telopea speciosissima]|uniref:probable membrane-associated kinase regulator 6 n=1 Tax=Telopea speciosissima TaxID=54955 RepID=UPI001CC7BDDF|nr:probable membrane-associated kinase regulator 6 [Telopea speciosissima]